MSLKNVHVLFVMAATLLALFCGVEALGSFRAAGSPMMGGAAVLSVVAAALLVRYEMGFIKRCREAGIR